MRYRRHGRLAALAIVAAAAVSSAGVAVGTTLLANKYIDAEGMYHACVQEENGNVRIVVPGTACRENESAIDWNQRGPEGPQGPRGPAGQDGGGITSLGSLDGLPCKIRDNDGTTVINQSGGLGGDSTTYIIWCLRADRYEPNNDRASATDISNELVGPPGPFPAFLNVIGLTLYPEGDHDWFVMHDRALANVNGPFGARMDVYRDGVLVAENLEFVPATPFMPPPPGTSYMNDVPGPHDWEFHVKPASPRPVSYGLTGFGGF